MPPKITASQRQVVRKLLAQGFDRETVAAQVGVTPGHVSAVAAHVKMGTYLISENVGRVVRIHSFQERMHVGISNLPCN
jgi:hypothetical protein